VKSDANSGHSEESYGEASDDERLARRSLFFLTCLLEEECVCCDQPVVGPSCRAIVLSETRIKKNVVDSPLSPLTFFIFASMDVTKCVNSCALLCSCNFALPSESAFFAFSFQMLHVL